MSNFRNRGIGGSAVSSLSESQRVDEGELNMASNDDVVAAAREAKKKSKAWATNGANDMFWSSGETATKIKPGLYQCFVTDETGPALRKMAAQTDDLIMVDKVGPMFKVVEEIMEFWKPEMRKRYEDRGFLYKRGILMFGPPGSGKTATIQMLIKLIIERGGVAVYAKDPHVIIACLQMIRRIQPELPVIVIMEDFEIIVNRGSNENEWLSVMDGEAQVDNVVFLGTTNYIEKLDDRFIDRPSRFDTVIPVPMPSALTRATYMIQKEPTMTVAEIQHWVKNTKNYSIAHLKELMIAVFVYQRELTGEITRIAKMRKKDFKDMDLTKAAGSEDEGSSMGFGASKNHLEHVDWEEFAETHDLEMPKKDEE